MIKSMNHAMGTIKRCLRALPLAALLCALCLGFVGCMNVDPDGSPSAPAHSSTAPDSMGSTDGSVENSSAGTNGGDEELPDDSTVGGDSSSGNIELPDQPF